MFWYIKNHNAQALLGGIDPSNIPERPKFPSKQAMLDWAHADETNWYFYNLSEPRDPSRRCSKDNPVAYVHGIVCDFDTKIPREMLLGMVKKVSPDFPVAYVSETYSGGARVVWLFEQKIPVFDAEVCKKLLERLVKDIKVPKHFPGYDEKSIDPSQYFELGQNWQKISDGKIPSKVLSGLLFEVAKKADVSAHGPEIPIADIAAEVERRFPGRWKGSFQVGSMGVRFWDQKADNTTGCWVRETGCYAFTGEGRFMPWGEILGSEFVRSYENNRIGAAIDRIYFDGKTYWGSAKFRDDFIWEDYGTEVLRRRLASAGLRKEQRRNEPMSEVDRALAAIESTARVDGIFPFLYRGEDVVFERNQRFLNVSRVRVLQPHPGKCAWGEGFPWIAEYLDQLFDDEQRKVFIAWLAHFYASALRRNLRKGQALFVAGPAKAGKTFLSKRIVGDLMGGSAEATNFLLGKTEFNSGLFEVPCWTIDDAQAAADGKGHEIYSQTIKKVVANFDLTYRRMFTNPVTMDWVGRVLITLNDDPESIGMLPNVEASLLDKVIFLKAGSTTCSFDGAQSKVAAELPFFGAFLRDHIRPEELEDGYRFGVKAYHHPELLKTALAASPTAAVRDLLSIWRGHFFAAADAKVEFWEGGSSDLFLQFSHCESLRPLVHKTVTSVSRLGRDLTKLTIQGATPFLQLVSNRPMNLYRVFRE